MKAKQILFTLLLFVMSIQGFSQGNGGIEMADELYQSGKIYVVTIVLSVIFIGIIGYLIILDRKVKKLEEEIKNKQS